MIVISLDCLAWSSSRRAVIEEAELSKSTRIFFRVPDELAEALDALIEPLREETMGAVQNRSQAARYLLNEVIRERQKQAQRFDLLDQAFSDLDESSQSLSSQG